MSREQTRRGRASCEYAPSRRSTVMKRFFTIGCSTATLRYMLNQVTYTRRKSAAIRHDRDAIVTVD